ncbi:uncharacterized protein LOC135388022 [Ornithodoros turicata]|uniref:uncharacterized protein LOC135388022 n=1 Tax=Ornithodoros turicata TaxID=34597 RepID=UPI00313A05A7
MELKCVISQWSSVLPVLLVLEVVTPIAGNPLEMCHSDQNCTAPYRCVDYHCTCPEGYDVTKWGCEPRPRELEGELNGPCLESTSCPLNAECRRSRCECKERFVGMRNACYRKAFPGEPCEVAEQCPRLATCESGVCACLQGTRTTATSCVTFKTPKRSIKSLEVYKAAMIVAACLMVVVLLAFLACVIKKSFFDGAPSTLPSVFSVSETVPEARHPTYEKPPSYEDVVRSPPRQEEPPSYADVMGACGSSHNPGFVPDV